MECNKKFLKIRDCRNENRLKDEDRVIAQEENKEIKIWKSEEKYMKSREPVKEIQHTKFKRKRMGAHCPRNWIRNVYNWKTYAFRSKGSGKTDKCRPQQNTYTWNSKHNEKRREVPESEGNRRSHTRDGNQKSSDQSISLEVRRQLFMLFKSKGEKRYQLEFCTKLNYQHQCGLDITLFLCERSPKIYLLWTLYQENARGCTLAKQGSKQKMRITQDLQN